MSAVLETREPSARYLDTLEPELVRQFDLVVGASTGVTRLRELILALAMQGKLLPQDPTDEPADKLLRRLVAERSESTLRRRTASRTEERPADEAGDVLPSSWKAASLSAISVKLTDGSHSPPSDAGSGIPMLSSQNVLESGAIDFDSPSRYVSVHDFERENVRTNVTPGDVLLTIVASLGRSAVVPVDAPPFVLQRSVAVIRTGLFPSFLAMFLRSPAARAYYDEHGKGTAQKGIYLGKLGELTLPIPPLAEQARIVARVDELMRLCDALEAKGRLEAEQHARLLGTLLGTLTDSGTPEELTANWQRVADHFDLLLDRPEAVDALEQTILQLAVRGLLVPQDPTEEGAADLLHRLGSDKERLIGEGKLKREKPLPEVEEDEKPFDLPLGWAWTRWADITLKIGDIDHRMPDEVDEGVPYVSPRDFFGLNSIDFEGAKKIARTDFLELSRKIQPVVGDLIYPRYGTIGNVRLVEDPRDFLASYSCAVIKVYHGFIDPRFQYFLSISDLIRRQAAAATNKTTQPNVGLKSIQQYVIPLPPLAEQVRIVSRVSDLLGLCADLRQRLAAIQATQSHLAEALVADVA